MKHYNSYSTQINSQFIKYFKLKIEKEERS